MTTHWLEHDGGRIAYSDAGSGPLVVCVPGIGDLRDEYRFLAPRLVDAGLRVISMDLRGHGESSVGWRDVTAEAVGSDVVALIRSVGAERAVVIGTSMAAGSAVWAAAEQPELVAGVVLVGPFVRDVGSAIRRALYRAVLPVLFSGPWGVAAWMKFWGGLFPSTRPDDFGAYAARLRANLSEPGRLATLRGMVNRGSSAGIESRLSRVQAPALVVMGAADRDFPSPADEAVTVAAAVRGDVALIDGAGHYPHVERPADANPRIVAFARRALLGADAPAAVPEPARGA